MAELLAPIDESGDLPLDPNAALAVKVSKIRADPEFIFIAKSLKLKGQHSFDVDDKRVFVVCDGDDCESFNLKKKRANIGITCKRCKGRKHDDKRCAERKVAHKDMRVATDSYCPISALDDAERTQRMSNLNVGRKIINKKLKRAKARLAQDWRKSRNMYLLGYSMKSIRIVWPQTAQSKA